MQYITDLWGVFFLPITVYESLNSIFKMTLILPIRFYYDQLHVTLTLVEILMTLLPSTSWFMATSPLGSPTWKPFPDASVKIALWEMAFKTWRLFSGLPALTLTTCRVLMGTMQQDALTEVYRWPSPFMAMYNPVFTDWMATTRRPTGIRLNKAGKKKKTRGGATTN